MAVTNNTAAGTPVLSSNAVLQSLKTIKPSEVDIVWIGQAGTPFMTTLTASGRDMNVAINSKDKYKSFGLSEITWTSGYEVFHEEIDELVRTFTVNGAIGSGATTAIVLTDTLGLKPNDVLRVVSATNNEQLLVVTVDSATQITVKRGFGTFAAAAIPDASVLIRQGTSVPGGQAGVTDIKVGANKVSNYVQKFVDTFSGKDVDDLVHTYANYNGNPKDLFIALKLQDHKKSLEYQAVFGQKKDGSSVSVDQNTHEGVIELAKRGWTGDLSASFSTGALSEALGATACYGKPDRKFVFCGTRAMAKFADTFKANLLVNSIKRFELAVEQYAIPNAQQFKFLQHPLLDSDSGLDGYAFVADMTEIQYVYGAGNKFAYIGVTGKTRVLPDPTKTNYATFEIDVVTFVSMKNRNAKAHGLFKIV